MATHARAKTSLLFALLLVATPALGADVPVNYTVGQAALKSAVSGTTLTFALYSDAACTVPNGAPQDVVIDNVAIVASLRRLTPKGGTRPPKTAELRTVLTGVTPTTASYLTVTGTGITAVGNVCQVQVSGVSGPTGATGATGETGATGAPGTFASTTCTWRWSDETYLTSWYTDVLASCLSGETAISGGYAHGGWNTTNSCIPIESARVGTTGWLVTWGAATPTVCATHSTTTGVLCCAP